MDCGTNRGRWLLGAAHKLRDFRLEKAGFLPGESAQIARVRRLVLFIFIARMGKVASGF